ncbi:hypothetical protein PENTCL1PPCAC_15411, partial [Pristionchus entomophagus]
MVILSGNTGVDSMVYQDILDQALVPFMRSTYGSAGVYVQDSGPAHVSKSTKRFLRNKGIQCEEYPPESPDVNPIELIWALMKRWIVNEHRPTNMDQLMEGAKLWWKNYCTFTLCRSVISG